MIHISGRIKAVFLVVVMTITLVSVKTPAFGILPTEEVVLLGFLFAGEIYLLLGGVAVTAKNVKALVHGERPGAGWRYHGYVLGALNIISGFVFLGLGLKIGADELIIFGDVQIGLGVVDVGLTIWAQSQEEGGDMSLAISPLVIPGQEGSPALGVGLRLVGW